VTTNQTRAHYEAMAKEAAAEKVDVSAILDTVDACLHSLNMDADVKAMHIRRFTGARSAVADLMKLVRAIDEECGNAKPDFGRVVRLAAEAAALARTGASA
jgi:hypothetical protein